jgi:hypothetical protein
MDIPPHVKNFTTRAAHPLHGLREARAAARREFFRAPVGYPEEIKTFQRREKFPGITCRPIETEISMITTWCATVFYGNFAATLNKNRLSKK